MFKKLLDIKHQINEKATTQEAYFFDVQKYGVSLGTRDTDTQANRKDTTKDKDKL